MDDPKTRLLMSMLVYAAQKGISIELLLQRVGLASAYIHGKGFQATPTDHQIHDICHEIIQLSNDNLFGLHFGESLQVAALGVVGTIIASSRTVGEGLTRAAEMTSMITDMVRLDIVHTATSFNIRFILSRLPDGTANADIDTIFLHNLVLRNIMDFFLVFTLHEVNGLVLERITPERIMLPYRALDVTETQEYRRVVRCQIIEQGDYALHIHKRYWNVPIITANHDLQQLLLEKFFLQQQKQGERKPFTTTIFNFLMANAYMGIPTLEEVAANLTISPRSLQRRLRDEQITYQEIVDAVRKSLALHYIERGGSPMKEISYTLGYNEVSAFYRAFKRWTGTTPTEYQKQSRQGNSTMILS